MQIRQASKNEYDAVRDFYWQLIDDMQTSEYHPKWQKGIYPADEELLAALENGELYLGIEEETIVAAMRVNHSVTEGYEKMIWGIDASADEITVIHMLGVGVALQGKGVAKKMVNFVIDNARQENQKAIRLDVLAGNIPAFRLYESMGFRAVGDIELFYEDTGLTEFTLYEYNL